MAEQADDSDAREGEHPGDAALVWSLLDGTFEGILLHDEHIVYANRAAGDITGIEREALVGRAMAELHPGEGPGTPVQGEQYGPMQFQVSKPGKPLKVIEARGKTVQHDGRLLWLSAFRDITRYKAIEEELRQRVALEDVVREVSSRFIHLPPEEVSGALDEALGKIGRFAGVDRSYIYVLDGGSLVAANLWASSGPTEEFRGMRFPVGEFQWAIDRMQSGEVCVYDVMEQYTPDTAAMGATEGSQSRSSLCVPLRGSSAMMGYVGFDALRDATTWTPETIRLLSSVGFVFASVLERSHVQQQLEQAYATLEQRVEDRTVELKAKQGQLVQAEKMAALGQLVAGVAHEINTPLGAIKSNTDTLMRSLSRLGELEDSEAGLPAGSQSLGKARRLLNAGRQVNEINVQAIERIVGIVNSLRQFARLDQADLDRVDLHEALENTLTLVRHQLKHRVEVHREYGEQPPVECYPDQINQVFMNLLVNAGQAIEGKGSIIIRTGSSGDQAFVEFVDDGKGIEAEQLSRIFDPGFTTKGVGVGTGLGLSIVHRIVEEHRGRIEVESEVGRGTTFRVRLPIDGRSKSA